LRIGRRIIVSLPNFGHWRIRASLLIQGRMPQTASLGFRWYETPNIHLCSIADFLALARACGASVEQAFAIDERGRTRRMQTDAWGPNLFAEGAIFILASASV
jgi:methionine biosynthesis protein MetW